MQCIVIGDTPVKMLKKILFVGGLGRSAVNFRLEFFKLLLSKNYEVHLCCTGFEEHEIRLLHSIGVITHRYEGERFSLNPLNEFKSIKSLYKIIKEVNPDKIFCYFIKPIIYGSLAGKAASVREVIAMIEGLGIAYYDDNYRFKKSLTGRIVVTLLRLVSFLVVKIIVLNLDDKNYLLEKKIASSNKIVNLGGIGVDLEKFKFNSEFPQNLNFLFVGRLLKSKGIVHFMKAAEHIKSKYPETIFTVLGDFEPKASEISKEDMHYYVKKGIINYEGYVNDIYKFYSNCSVMVLPSRYREGVPRVLQEAIAVGRPIITYDQPGCIDTVKNGTTGFIVSDRKQLIEKMEFFILNKKSVVEMGKKGRKLASKRFDINKKNEELLSIIEL